MRPVGRSLPAGHWEHHLAAQAVHLLPSAAALKCMCLVVTFVYRFLDEIDAKIQITPIMRDDGTVDICCGA